MLDYQAILEEIHHSLKNIETTGEVATYQRFFGFLKQREMFENRHIY